MSWDPIEDSKVITDLLQEKHFKTRIELAEQVSNNIRDIEARLSAEGIENEALLLIAGKDSDSVYLKYGSYGASNTFRILVKHVSESGYTRTDETPLASMSIGIRLKLGPHLPQFVRLILNEASVPFAPSNDGLTGCPF